MWIVLGVLALPLVEIGLFVTLGAKLGLWLTLAWVILTAVAGVLLLKGVSLGGQGLRQGLQEGLHDPLSPIMHRTLIGIAAVLLILPGFFTDAMGLILLLPPVRSGIIRLMAQRLRGVTIVQRGSMFEDQAEDERRFDDRLN
jgi:UPF0716 protein FxsA